MEGILLCRATERLYYLNTSAAFIWCCLEQGVDPSAIAEALGEKFEISQGRAQRDVLAALSNWRTEGLLVTTDLGIAEFPLYDQNTNAAPSMAGLPRSEDFVEGDVGDKEHPKCPDGTLRNAVEGRNVADAFAIQLTAAAYEDHYLVGCMNLCIQYDSLIARSIIHPIISHLEIASDQNKRTPSVCFRIVEEGSGFSLFRDDVKLCGSIPDRALPPLIHRKVLLAAYESSASLAAIHAGAVCHDRNCLLLPGASGSGKSTLTAALMNAGLTYLTDELVLLMPDSYGIRPLPVSLGLKRGSWSALALDFPEIEALPIYLQADGTEVRYLAPPESQLPKDCEYPIRCLVFPKYETGVRTKLARLTGAKALYRIAEAGYAVPGQLHTHVVADLVDWISPLECYELKFGDLNSAVPVIKELLS